MRAYFAREIVTETGILREAYLLEERGVITGIGKDAGDLPVTAYEGCTLAPGLIDLHTHGALGYETGFGGAEDLEKWAAFELGHGVTGFLPTTASIPLPRIIQAAADVRQAAARPGSNILGLHLEGPFFSPGEKIGAQNPCYIQERFTPEFREFLAANRDVVKYIAVDPALAAAAEIVPYCAGLGIRVSAAHSNISYHDFLAKKSWGFTGVTHAFNGMSGLDHRRPGLAYAACLDPDLYSEIICDGHHVCYPMIKLFHRLKGHEKAVLITDSIAATGMPPGRYTLGDVRVEVAEDGRVTKADGGLAGSTLTMDQALRNLVGHVGVPLEQAVFMASTAPARLLGLRSKGGLCPGKDADFIVLDAEYRLVATYIKGRRMFAKQGSG